MTTYTEAVRMPSWLRKVLPDGDAAKNTASYLKCMGIETVCSSAMCPNITECYSQPHATFMILGHACTRRCGFCGVGKGSGDNLKTEEARKIAEAAAHLGLTYVVITSVTRDDMPDSGAAQYAAVTKAIKSLSAGAMVEALVPDFSGSSQALETVLCSGIDVLSHNMETVRRLYPDVRPGFDYARSLALLRTAALSGRLSVKSGFMVGLGETSAEIFELMADIRAAGCAILTVGQYLRPRNASFKVQRYVPPEEFERLRKSALRMGFRGVSCGPFVRSSYKAAELI